MRPPKYYNTTPRCWFCGRRYKWFFTQQPDCPRLCPHCRSEFNPGTAHRRKPADLHQAPRRTYWGGDCAIEASEGNSDAERR